MNTLDRMNSVKIAVIDLGYNSIKLVNYEVKSDNTFEPYEEIGIKIKLGEGLDEHGYLNSKSIWRALEALKLFRDMLNVQGIKYVLAIATSAVREAQNKEEFLEQIKKLTGFRFKVVSEKEEALYSYYGAMTLINNPDVLFFDIGGGSLEIVRVEKLKVKKIISLPLGALRLTEKYCKKTGSINEKDYRIMKKYIRKMLPGRKSLKILPNTLLVGVGGTVRALAKYHQNMTSYPIEKIGNYVIDKKSIEFISNRFKEMSNSDMKKVDFIGSNRMETMKAGSCVIDALMEKMNLDQIQVSNRGVREGALLFYLQNPKISQVEIGKLHHAIESRKKPDLSYDIHHFVSEIMSVNLVDNKIKEILEQSLKYVTNKTTLANPLNWFYSIMDEDKPLSHKNHLMLALALIRTRNVRTAESLTSRYESILDSDDRKSTRKISACIMLFKFLYQTKLDFRLKKLDSNKILLDIAQTKNVIPKTLLKDVIRYFESTFDTHVSYSIAHKIRV